MSDVISSSLWRQIASLFRMHMVKSFINRLSKKFRANHETVQLDPSTRLRLSGQVLRVPVEGVSYVIEMGKQTIHLCPDLPVDALPNRSPCDYIVFDPELYYSGIAQTLRLRPKEKLTIDHREDFQKPAFSHTKDAFRRHLQITHGGDFLEFRDSISELGTFLSLLKEDNEPPRFAAHRQENLQKIIQVFGGPIVQLPADEALDTIKQVNQILKRDAHRKQDSFGNAGGLVELPPQLTPIIIGDLHAQLDNLLKILSENSFLDELERGEAALILLGDAVHPESEAELSNMDSSVLMMDLIFKLKLRYPDQVFFVVGNHDSFSPDVMKAGVPQSLVWERKVTKLRGEVYREELNLFYRQSPLVVISEDFVACHAGPTRSAVSLQSLVEARQNPSLVHELTWNRVKTKGYPLGYTKGDVRRFKKGLNLDDDTPFIVAHFPQSQHETLWLNVAEIPHHHVLYSAQSNQMAVITRVQGEMLPQIYPAEPMLGPINALARQNPSE